jgi:serine/threonine-protein kinase
VCAERILGGSYLEQAEAAAWTAFEHPAEVADLCCGLAGRGFALLEIFHATGDSEWLSRAHILAEQAATVGDRGLPNRDSLYKGDVGLACLAAALAAPEGAGMPFFSAIRTAC